VNTTRTPLVTTIKERCRVCYTCVRECPAKAIRITASQAEVVPARCIGCGNCVRVCSQHAKLTADSRGEVAALLASGVPVAACIAPSFPAEFLEADERQVVGMVRALGFRWVTEVSFGADLVARDYRNLLAERRETCFISTACPAIVGYVERYHPNLVSYLAPVVSPMVAMARALRALHGPELKVVFVGPCIAKKGEAWGEAIAGEVDAVLTFAELRALFAARGLAPESASPSDFDPPHGGLGALFPVSRGMLQAADIQENLITDDVVAADGRAGFVEVIKEFESEDLNAHLLELLCCSGCTMGAGMTSREPQFRRRSRVSKYARRRMERLDRGAWRENMAFLAGLDLRRTYAPDDQRFPVPSDEALRQILVRMGKRVPEDELNCGACGYDTCAEHAVAIHRGLAESEMCLPYTIEELKRTVGELAVSNDQLASTQQALMHSERLASMGQLAAGIAHEVNNPLGVVLLYANLLLEEGGAGAPGREDVRMIAEQAERCRKIVSGLLNFARQNKVFLQTTDLCALVESALKGVPIPTGIQVEVRHGSGCTEAEMDPDQMVQVLTNLVSNACEAMGESGALSLETRADEQSVTFSVSDTGTGITRENLKRIYEPFFTTKPMGRGTGLGLPVTYGIVKMHHGEIRVESNADPSAGPTGTTFTVTLPRRAGRE